MGIYIAVHTCNFS